jgi:hypothetical protein
LSPRNGEGLGGTRLFLAKKHDHHAVAGALMAGEAERGPTDSPLG